MSVHDSHQFNIERWQAVPLGVYRIILVDCDSDVGEWDDIVSLVEHLHRTVMVDSVGVLGSAELFSPSKFLAHSAAIFSANNGRGRLVAQAVEQVTVEVKSDVRMLVLSAGIVFDRPDWDDPDPNRRPCSFVYTAWEPPSANRLKCEAFLRGNTQPSQALQIRANGWLRITTLPRDSRPSPAWVQGSVVQEVSDEVQALDMEFVTRKSFNNTIEVVTATWSLRMVHPPEPLQWQGPELLSAKETNALRDFLDGRSFQCPTCGAVKGHVREGALTLRCQGTQTKRGFLFDRPEAWALPTLEAAATRARATFSWLIIRLARENHGELWNWPFSLLPLFEETALERRSPSEWAIIGEIPPQLQEKISPEQDFLDLQESFCPELSAPHSYSMEEGGADDQFVVVARL